MNPPVSQRKLLFLDCDSTLSAIEGIDELARARGEEVFSQVVALTNAAMNGEIAIHEVFPRRMAMIRPDRALCDEVAARYIEEMVPGVREFIAEARENGWLPVILSGGFAPLILPLAGELGIENVEAVPIHFDADGAYAGYGEDYPTTRNLGKNEVIRAWRDATSPERVVMMGDGVSDLETKPDVDLFVGFGGVVERPAVRAGCGFWLADMRQRQELWEALRETAPGS
jgi:phosphoserine phosphatase